MEFYATGSAQSHLLLQTLNDERRAEAKHIKSLSFIIGNIILQFLYSVDIICELLPSSK